MLHKRSDVEQLMREAIADPREKPKLIDATGWHNTILSKITGPGGSLVALDKLNSMLEALGTCSSRVTITRPR